MKIFAITILISLLISSLAWSMGPERSPKSIVAFSKEQEKSVRKLYDKWYSSFLRYLLTKGKWPSTFAGMWANSRLSKGYISRFIKKFSINVDEMEKPVSSFKTFNQFFTRKLKRGARTLPEDKNAVISPADGTLFVAQNLSLTTNFPIKDASFTVKKMLQSEELAKLFEGGTAFIIRLAPWDYHRFHFPLAGTPSAPKKFRGRYESVHPFVYLSGVQPLEVNERHLITYASESASTVAFILVGALFVGTIKETYIPDQKYKQGQDMGYFEFGGSTIVMLFQKDTITVVPEIIANSKAEKETVVRMGQAIAQIKPKGERSKRS